MTTFIDYEHEQLWDSVKILSDIDPQKAEVVFKMTIEKSFRLMNVYTPIVSKLHFSIPSQAYLSELKELETLIRKQISKEISIETYESILDYIGKVCCLTDDPEQTNRQILATILSDQAKKQRRTGVVAEQLHLSTKSVSPIMTLEKNTEKYYTPSEVAKKLGLSDQTVRRMCEKGRFIGSYQTDGGHWRIPAENFITTREEDKVAEEYLQYIDKKNKEAGDVDEFDV